MNHENKTHKIICYHLMAAQNASVQNSPAALLNQLVKAVLNEDEGCDVSQHFQFALRIISSNFAPSVEQDEFHVSEKIKRKLAREGRESDAAYFSELHRKLQAQGKLQNRWSILYLLLSLASNQKDEKAKPSSASIFGRGLPNLATSTPFVPRNVHQTPGISEFSSGSNVITQSSGIGSGISNISGTTPTPHSYAPGYLTTPGMTFGPNPQSVGSQLAQMLVGDTGSKTAQSKLVPSSKVQRSNVTKQGMSSSPMEENTSFEVTEEVIVRDLVYVFQGIEGKYIKYNYSEDAFRLDSQVGIPRPTRDLVHKLAELGWLFLKVKKYVEKRSQDKAFGLVGQSFTAALQQELTEYYRLLAVLEAQQEPEDGFEVNSASALTLLQLNVWTFDPLNRMKWLAILVDGCKNKKGGALASAIHSYTFHGDGSVQKLINHILKLVAFPLRQMMDKWIYDGLLADKYHEFFVAADPSVKEEKLWHKKYTLRKSMLPSFISMDQARQILLIGKSINFLKQVCKDNSPITGKGSDDIVEKYSKYENTEIFLDKDFDGKFQKVIDKAYQDTSKKLLDVLHQRFKFLDHLKAMRRYLLLGQGDFIKHLMDLLQADLVKPAQFLYLHNLTGVLETAIRATNAQYDDSEILDRLDVRLLELSPGDTGWDVFSLDYHVDGPISTVFTPQCKILYLRVFNFLWRAKRMEYILTQVWKDQMSNARLLMKEIPELSPLLHHIHTLAAEMVHFIHQMQYYINFEVMECSYDELWKQVNKATDLDKIIAAHETFLDTILQRSLLDNESQKLLTQLRVIFDLVVQFQGMQEEFFKVSLEERERRRKDVETIEGRTEMGEWGTTQLEEEDKRRLQQEFKKNFIPSERAKLKVLAQTLQDMVQKFLVMLTSHSDDSLRLLAVRLDFNEVYKAKEPKLRSPEVYQKRKKRVL
ncbi:gamma-tubulin complex component 3 homolog isoform X2 [Apostichopus japonicus]|uniref:gamma-tubulin complex component 3 homolog isoform X2 n=1 Tax=Stichopus japonicus TaxID=307972 RepID=UPI003AB126D8